MQRSPHGEPGPRYVTPSDPRNKLTKDATGGYF